MELKHILRYYQSQEERGLGQKAIFILSVREWLRLRGCFVSRIYVESGAGRD